MKICTTLQKTTSAIHQLTRDHFSDTEDLFIVALQHKRYFSLWYSLIVSSTEAVNSLQSINFKLYPSFSKNTRTAWQLESTVTTLSHVK